MPIPSQELRREQLRHPGVTLIFTAQTQRVAELIEPKFESNDSVNCDPIWGKTSTNTLR